jgi:hypothetical protein
MVPSARVARTPKYDEPVGMTSSISEITIAALQMCPQTSDWDILRDHRPREEQIQKLWTRPSILVVRLLLWLSYTFTLVCFASIVSLAAYRHADEEASK